MDDDSMVELIELKSNLYSCDSKEHLIEVSFDL